MQISVWVEFNEFHKFIDGKEVAMTFMQHRGTSVNVICDQREVTLAKKSHETYTTYSIRRNIAPQK